MSTKTWPLALKDQRFLRVLILAMFCVIIGLIATKHFLIYNDTRSGSLLNDPILALFKPTDFSWVTFFMIFGSTIFGITLILKYPVDTVQWMFAYTFLLLFRMLCMYFIPLEPPKTMIYLHDPIVGAFVGRRLPVHDLFFSGHTATAFMVYLGVRKYKPLFLVMTFAIGVLVVAQHVHYSIDAIAAPFFAYFSLKLGKKLTEFLGVPS